MVILSSVIAHLENHNIRFKYKGDLNLSIDKFSTLENYKNSSVIWISDIKKIDLDLLVKTNDLLIVTVPEYEFELSKIFENVMYGDNSKEIFFTILADFIYTSPEITGQKTNSIIKAKNIGKNVIIGFNCYIGNEVEIGDDVIIKNNVSIESKVKIGDRTIIHSGVVLGTDGYGFFQNSDGQNIRVPHFGGIIIGSDVEIGANTCIDRGTLEDTRIGNNVKIDNLCHIAHNVMIEENVCVIALSMIAGSVILKKNAYIAPSSSIRNQVTIGENSVVGLGAVVVKDVEKNVVVAGVPAKIIRVRNDALV